MDPFFTANQRGPLSGGALGYFRDLHETYKQLPKQSSAARQTIQNATNNRANEQTMIESILASNRDLEDEVAMLREDFGHAALTVMQQRQKLSQLNSKLLPNTEDVSSKSGSDRGSKSVRIHEHEKPDRGESEADDVRVPGDVLPSVLPDTGGPGVGDEPQGRPDSVGSEDGGSGLPGVRDSQIDEQHGSEGGVRDE